MVVVLASTPNNGHPPPPDIPSPPPPPEAIGAYHIRVCLLKACPHCLLRSRRISQSVQRQSSRLMVILEAPKPAFKKPQGRRERRRRRRKRRRRRRRRRKKRRKRRRKRVVVVAFRSLLISAALYSPPPSPQGCQILRSVVDPTLDQTFNVKKV